MRTVEESDIPRVAAQAGVDPRTARAVLTGRGSKATRSLVIAALRELRFFTDAKRLESQTLPPRRRS